MVAAPCASLTGYAGALNSRDGVAARIVRRAVADAAGTLLPPLGLLSRSQSVRSRSPAAFGKVWTVKVWLISPAPNESVPAVAV